MADFNFWGYAIAEVLGVGGDIFQKSYLNNQSSANREAVESHPIASSIILLMANKHTWQGSITELLQNLQILAEKEGVDTKDKLWAKDANVLSRRLKEIKSNLSELGIIYNIKHTCSYKEITIENRLYKKNEEKRDDHNGK